LDLISPSELYRWPGRAAVLKDTAYYWGMRRMNRSFECECSSAASALLREEPDDEEEDEEEHDGGDEDDDGDEGYSE
jgi:hypothetical protein